MDGQKVSVADIRRMKSEAQDAQKAVESLGATNADLSRKLKAKAPKPEPVELDTIRYLFSSSMSVQSMSSFWLPNRPVS